jgi:hypothetical protein
MATSVAPLTTTVMNSVPAERSGTASGINNAVSRIAAVLSIAVLGIVMFASFKQHFSSRLAEMNLEPKIRQDIEMQEVRLAAIEIPREIDNPLKEEIRRSVDDAFVAGFRLVMFIAAALALLSAATAMLMIN